MGETCLIVGLGNPGMEYERTRHNIGFLAVEKMAGRHQAGWSFEPKFEARLARADWRGRKMIYCQPQTYMNLSGTAVRAVAEYYKIALGSLMVVMDDANLPFGEIRMRGSGSSGGHHGLDSVEHHLGTRNYGRLRVGIGREPGQPREITNYVLGRFKPEERVRLERVLERVVSQLECWATDGIAKAMNQFNGAVEAPMPKES